MESTIDIRLKDYNRYCLLCEQYNLISYPMGDDIKWSLHLEMIENWYSSNFVHWIDDKLDIY